MEIKMVGTKKKKSRLPTVVLAYRPKGAATPEAVDELPSEPNLHPIHPLVLLFSQFNLIRGNKGD